MGMNRAQRRQAAKEFQAQLASGAVDLAQHAARPKAVTFGWLNTGSVSAEFLKGVLATAARSAEFGYAIRPRDVQLTNERPRALNLLLKSFVEQDGGTKDDYLLLADTSIAFAPQDVAMLIAADSAIAGALYFSAALGVDPWPTAWVERDDHEAAEPGVEPEPVQYRPITLPTPPEDFDESNQEQLEAWMAELSLPVRVAAAGAGFLLIRRDAAEGIVADYQWPFEAVQDRREDLVFGLRAGELGFDSVIMPAARVGYIASSLH